MNADFSLRQDPRYHNPAITLAFNAIYGSQHDIGLQGLQGPQGSNMMDVTYTGGTAKPDLKPLPVPMQFPTGQRPYLNYHSYVQPEYQTCYKLPKQSPHVHFDPSAYDSVMQVAFKAANYNPEMPQAHMLFMN